MLQVKIFSGSFGGVTIWENPTYVSPAKYRQQFRLKAKNKYLNRVEQKVHAELTKPEESYKLTPYEDIFKEQPNLEEEEKEKVSAPKKKFKKKSKVLTPSTK